ncbi:TPA: hypothetical protein HA244_04425 [Candidatus Micrarchaeota archaeon]|nr:hypothetical protein [Candidatus Micrarchaeota archaeon]
MSETQQTNAQAQHTGFMAGEGQRTLLPLHIKPGTPAFLRQKKRYDYVSEFVDFEKDRYKSTFKAIFCLSFGVLTLQAFPPGGLLMFALAARYQDIAWMDGFIANSFGKYRSIVTVD